VPRGPELETPRVRSQLEDPDTALRYNSRRSSLTFDLGSPTTSESSREANVGAVVMSGNNADPAGAESSASKELAEKLKMKEQARGRRPRQIRE
ncbi:unnamed protein product, partial [Amoebophrya sp. A25]